MEPTIINPQSWHIFDLGHVSLFWGNLLAFELKADREVKAYFIDKVALKQIEKNEDIDAYHYVETQHWHYHGRYPKTGIAYIAVFNHSKDKFASVSVRKINKG